MLKEAIEKIQQLSSPHIVIKGEHMFMLNSSGSNYMEILSRFEIQDILLITSLEALANLIKNEIVNIKHLPVYIFVPNHNLVKCYASPYNFDFNKRYMLYHVMDDDAIQWKENTELNFEAALIAIRTQFQHTADVDYLLKLLSSITTGAKMTRNDTGIVTNVMMKSGIDLQESVPIRPFVKLKPYRTFPEVEQPESEFHIRIDQNGIKFIESDGGMWKLEARRIIRDHLINSLDDLVKSDHVMITI